MNIKTLESSVGSLSKTTKIPAPGFSTSAFDCLMGKKLAKIPGSVCHDCYAMHGNNLYPTVEQAHKKRSKAVNKPYWTNFMIELIRRTEEKRASRGEPTGYFRWFNSGDLQSVQHLEKIVEIAKRMPKIKFWLPTKEYGMVREFLKSKKFPKNLCVRLSAYMIDQKAPRKYGLPGSGVVYDKSKSNCHAYSNPDMKANCGSCRMCWDNKVKEIYYPWHMGRKVGK